MLGGDLGWRSRRSWAATQIRKNANPLTGDLLQNRPIGRETHWKSWVLKGPRHKFVFAKKQTVWNARLRQIMNSVCELIWRLSSHKQPPILTRPSVSSFHGYLNEAVGVKSGRASLNQRDGFLNKSDMSCPSGHPACPVRPRSSRPLYHKSISGHKQGWESLVDPVWHRDLCAYEQLARSVGQASSGEHWSSRKNKWPTQKRKGDWLKMSKHKLKNVIDCMDHWSYTPCPSQNKVYR